MPAIVTTYIEVLKNAKTFIDEASANESTSGKPKTWYYKGNVYWAMNDSKNPIFSESGQNPLLVAVESYRKAFELDPKYEFAIECFGNKIPAIQIHRLGILLIRV